MSGLRHPPTRFGVWNRAELQGEFFAAAWSRGASRPGGIIVFGWGTPATFNTDFHCKSSSQRQGASNAKLRLPLVYRRAESGTGYFVERDGRTRAGYPLYLRALGWYVVGVDQRSSLPQGLDLISRRKGHGLRYDCSATGRVVIHAQRVKDARGRETGSYFGVSLQNDGRLIASALLNDAGDSWFRVSRRCARVRR